MPGGISSRAASAALNHLTGRAVDFAPQTMQLALLTAPPDINAGLNRINEVSASGYVRQSVSFSRAVAGQGAEPSSIVNSANVLFGPFTAAGGLPFPATHCVLVGTGLPVNPNNLLAPSVSQMGTPLGWQSKTNATALESSAEQFHDGTRSLKIVTSASGESTVESVLLYDVSQNTTYLAEAWIYSAVAGLTGAVDFAWYDNANTYRSSSLGTNTSLPAGTWVKVSRSVALRSTEIYKARVNIRVNATAAAQAWYADEVSFKATSTEDILMSWQFDQQGQAAQNESLQISAGDLSMSLG